LNRIELNNQEVHTKILEIKENYRLMFIVLYYIYLVDIHSRHLDIK